MEPQELAGWYCSGLEAMGFSPDHARHLGEWSAAGLAPECNKDIHRWEDVLDSLVRLRGSGAGSPTPCLGQVQVAGGDGHESALADAVVLGTACSGGTGVELAWKQALEGLMPWRKGPFVLGGCCVDTEWRSDLKWDRLAPHIQPLAGRRVLDVGCGSGYHTWRMHLDGACCALGLEPYHLSVFQFRACAALCPQAPLRVLPFGLEAWHQKSAQLGLEAFDTVFSMGVLYHRRDHMEHLTQLGDLLVPGGELVLETLVLPGEGLSILEPPGRYASMGNIHAIPTVHVLADWCRQAGFEDLQVIHTAPTQTLEQRRTPWMPWFSLADALSPQDAQLTVEGHPRPHRSLILAKKA